MEMFIGWILSEMFVLYGFCHMEMKHYIGKYMANLTPTDCQRV